MRSNEYDKVWKIHLLESANIAANKKRWRQKWSRFFRSVGL